MGQGAAAFTSGQTIALGDGVREDNLPVIADEAAHTVQQSGTAAPATSDSELCEAEARAASDLSRRASITAGSAELGVVQRITPEEARSLQSHEPAPSMGAAFSFSIVAGEIIDRLIGYTSKSDSKYITDALVSLPGWAQSAVLRELMKRHLDAGEPTGTGMLYFLFEDLQDADRRRLIESLRVNEVLSQPMVDTLLVDRPLGAKYLPYTTHKAAEAAQYWADVSVQARREGTSGSAKENNAVVMGLLASLWLPDTAGTTVVTLATAGFGVGMAKTFPTASAVIAALNAGPLAYDTTIKLQELSANHDLDSGRVLNADERLAKQLVIGANLIFLAVTPIGIRGISIEIVPRASVPGLPDGYVQIPVKGMPQGQEVWVPRPLARRMGATAATDPASMAWTSGGKPGLPSLNESIVETSSGTSTQPANIPPVVLVIDVPQTPTVGALGAPQMHDKVDVATAPSTASQAASNAAGLVPGDPAERNVYAEKLRVRSGPFSSPDASTRLPELLTRLRRASGISRDEVGSHAGRRAEHRRQHGRWAQQRRRRAERGRGHWAFAGGWRRCAPGFAVRSDDGPRRGATHPSPRRARVSPSASGRLSEVYSRRAGRARCFRSSSRRRRVRHA